MANRYFSQFFYSLLKKPVFIGGKIALNSSAAVTSFDIDGVASVVKTGTGEYTVTLQDKYNKLVSIQGSNVDSAQDLAIAFTSIDVTSTKTFKVITKVAGTAANITDACDIYLDLILSNSSV